MEGLKNSVLQMKVIEPEGGHFILVDITESIK